jgi:histidine triad (HIT) family protein
MTQETTDCSFCQIVAGDKNAYVIYEDDIAFAILSRNQSRTGHCLIIPKQHATSIFDIDEDALKHLMSVVKKISHDLKEKLNAQGMHFVHTENTHLTVPHFAIHLYPNFKPEPFDMRPYLDQE